MGNPFFNHGATGLTNEYNLYSNATDEICEMFGIDFSYLPRTLVKPDHIFGEDVNSSFDSNTTITLYIENAEEFNGVGDLFNKFGFSIDNQLILTVQQDRFDTTVGEVPEIGDLIYHPPSRKILEVKDVKYENSYYQFGGGGLVDNGQMTYKFTCTLFEASHEDFNTGIDDVDDLLDTLTDVNTTDETDEIDTAKTDVLDFTEEDIFGNL
jgi:hypothetical protein